MRQVFIDALGICEYCDELLDVTDFQDTDYTCIKCPKCDEPLSKHKSPEDDWLDILRLDSFGWRMFVDGWKQVRWVGKSRKWRRTKPRESFILQGWRILVN